MIISQSLSDTAQLALFLILGESAKASLEDSKYKNICTDLLDKCWEWFENKSIEPNELYGFIDNGEDDLSILQESASKNTSEIIDCIIDSIAFICKKAYEYNNQKYVPQIIESIDDSFYDKLKNKLLALDILSLAYFNNLESYFSFHNNTLICKKEIYSMLFFV